jgi:hypothetical protein
MGKLRRLAKAEARVTVLTEEAAKVAVRRSAAEAALAQAEVTRLRAELDALHVRYVELERRTGSDRIAG